MAPTRRSIQPLLALASVLSTAVLVMNTSQRAWQATPASAGPPAIVAELSLLSPPVPSLLSSPPPPPPPSPLPRPAAATGNPRPKVAAALPQRKIRRARRAADVLVGLNKKVYRFVAEREYACAGLGGGRCTFTTERSRFGEAHALIDVLKDPRSTRPLDFRPTDDQLKGVIISEKDASKRGSWQFKANAYDFEVGYNKKDSTVWRPFLCNELNRKTNTTIAEALLGGSPRRLPPAWQGLKVDRWPAQQPAVAAFVSNCVGWRLEYLRELRRHVRLDSFGGCAHNNDTCPKRGKHKCDKVVMAGAYAFVFAFENTEESHYVTEKVYTGLRAGAVPIYKGAPEILQHVPGAASIIQADDFGGAAALGRHLQALLADEAAYAKRLEWDLAAFAASEAVAQCPWQCRVCEHVARMRTERHGRER